MYNSSISDINEMYNYSSSAKSTAMWSIILLVVAIVLTFVIFFALVKSNKTPKGKFMNWLKEFLNFRRIFIENLLKFAYLFASVCITLFSFQLIKESFLEFLGMIILGNLLLRLVFEFALMMIMIWKNTSDLSSDVRLITTLKEENFVLSENQKSSFTKESEYQKPVSNIPPQQFLNNDFKKVSNENETASNDISNNPF